MPVGLWQGVNRLWPLLLCKKKIIIKSYSCYRTNKGLIYCYVMYKMDTSYTFHFQNMSLFFPHLYSSHASFKENLHHLRFGVEDGIITNPQGFILSELWEPDQQLIQVLRSYVERLQRSPSDLMKPTKEKTFNLTSGQHLNLLQVHKTSP